MKKIISMIMVLILTLALFAIPVMAEEESSEGGTVGYLSFLNLSEDELEARRESELAAYDFLREDGVIERIGDEEPRKEVVFYDSLDAMLMGLTAGEVDALNVPFSTAQYLTNMNDNVQQAILFHPEKAEDGYAKFLLRRLSNGYSFMMLEENSDLRDQFDQAIAEMKEDGTLDKLIQEYITDAIETGEPAAVTFEEFDGEPIKVAVTGCLPPMDYVAADGSFAGFNTAILAEIGKRLEKNIELTQVDSVGRALALAEGNVDVVFWTRARAGRPDDDSVASMSEEERKAFIQEKRENGTEEENAIIDNLKDALPSGVYAQRDLPEGTVITAPYYTDLNVLVTLK